MTRLIGVPLNEVRLPGNVICQLVWLIFFSLPNAGLSWCEKMVTASL